MASIDKNHPSTELDLTPTGQGYIGEPTIETGHPVEVLDMEAVGRLQSLNSEKDPDFFARLVEAFLNFGQKNVTQLNEALHISDWPAVGRHAHALKGSCANFGAMGAVALCKEIEQNVSAQQYDGMQRLVSRVTNEFTLINHMLKSMGGTSSYSSSSH